MRQPLWRRWLVMGVVGAVPVLGCNHAEHQCDCSTAMARTVYVLPTPQPTMVASTKPVNTPPPEPPKVEMTSAKTETPIETPVAKKPEPPPGTIAVPVVAGLDQGTKTGTLELTTADAEAMGVRPGYTPGALFMPPKRGGGEP